MIRVYDSGPVLPSGNAGSATATANLGPIIGKLRGVYVSYGEGAASTTDTVVSTATPPVTLLTLTHVNTSAWYYPQAPICNANGSSATYDGTHPVMDEFWMADAVTVAWAGADPDVLVRAYVVVEVPH